MQVSPARDEVVAEVPRPGMRRSGRGHGVKGRLRPATALGAVSMEVGVMSSGANEGPLSLQTFLERLLGGFRERGISYCILRNYAQLPVNNLSNDIDIFVDEDRVEECIRFLSTDIGVTVTGCVRRGFCVNLFIAGVRWRGGDAIQVDYVYRQSWKGLPFLPNYDVLNRARTLPGHRDIIRVPSTVDEAVTSFFASYLIGGWIKEKYQPRVRETFANERETIRHNLEPAFGASLTDKLIDAVIADAHDRMLALLPKLRWTLLYRSVRCAPVTSLCAIASHYGHEVIIRFTAKYLTTVSVLGPDGAGKSAVLRALEPQLANTAKVINVRHLKPDIFFRKRRQSAGPVTDPHGKPPRSTAASLLKFVLWALECWIDRLLTDRSNRTLDIWDRYYHDLLVDPLRYRYGGPMWLARWIGKIVPRPDLWIVFDAPTEVLQARKQEVSFAETARQRQGYLDLARGMNNAVVVDASQPLEKVVGDVIRAIVEFMAERAQRRFGL